MKVKGMILGILAGAVVLFMCYEYTNADAKADKSAPAEGSSLKIGVVSVRKIFQECRRNMRYRQKAAEEQDNIIAELEKLSRQIEDEKKGLKTLKEGSSDYMAQLKGILERQANLSAQQEFGKQQIELRDQQWTEGLYGDILKEVDKVAKQKGLALVFEKDEVELPAATANELMMTIRTHTLLYSGGCVDITGEVTAGLDAQENTTP